MRPVVPGQTVESFPPVRVSLLDSSVRRLFSQMSVWAMPLQVRFFEVQSAVEARPALAELSVVAHLRPAEEEPLAALIP